MPTPTSPARPAPSPLRHLLLRMIVLVLLLDAAALAVYYLADVPLWPTAARTAFTVVWTAATLAIVIPLLLRVRRERDLIRRR